VWPCPFDLRVSICGMPSMCCISIYFSVDSSSRFPFRVWTHAHTDKVTDKTDHRAAPQLPPSWVIRGLLNVRLHFLGKKSVKILQNCPRSRSDLTSHGIVTHTHAKDQGPVGKDRSVRKIEWKQTEAIALCPVLTRSVVN